jgi:hypothetical protein
MRANETFPAPPTTIERSVVDEGARAGAFAASGVAVGFLIADVVVTGVPFVTPELLGRGLASLLGVRAALPPALLVVGYTLVHYAAFALLGVAAAAVLRTARRDSGVLAGALLLFAITEVAFAALVAALQATTATGAVTWIQLVGGNVVGCALLALALGRRHPEFRERLDDAVRGTGSWAVR